MKRKEPKELIGGVREALEQAGIDVRRGPERSVVTWELGEARSKYLVDVTGPNGQGTQGEPQDPSDPLPTIRVLPHATPVLAKSWIASGQAFADLSGNVFIDAPGLLVRITGEPQRVPTARATRRTGNREWRGAALKVVFHLLCDPKLADLSVRALAAFVGVANVTADSVLRDLRESGHLVDRRPRGRLLTPDFALTNRWAQEYGRKLRPDLLRGRFTSSDPNWYRRFDPVEFGALWGGESAAEVMAVDLRPGIRTLYVDGSMRSLARSARLRADPDGPIEVRQLFWNRSLSTPLPDVTPRMLTVADLSETNDPRCISAAAELMQQLWDA